MGKKIVEVAHFLPHPEIERGRFADGSRSGFREERILMMGARDEMVVLEEQLRSYEEELTRLRVENEQLRRSSQAFGELAERLNVALRTATRVNRRPSTAADFGGRRRAVAES